MALAPGGPVQCFQGRVENSVILHCGDGLHYHIREICRSRLRLHCRHYKSRGLGCPGTASVSLDTGFLKHLQNHNHPPDHFLKDDYALRTAIIQETTRSTFGEKVMSILNRLKMRVHEPALASRFTRVRMASSMYKKKYESYPPIPKTLLYLGVLLGSPNMRPVCKTVDGSDYIFQGVVGNSLNKTESIVFVSGRMIQFLQTREGVHVDGTFKKRPRKPKCRQIFNIVVKYGDIIIGVVRVLMRSKSEAAYNELLDYLVDVAPNFNPRRVWCDFERAIMNAFRRKFPGCRVVGCLWHYGVSIGRHAREIGLAPMAGENELVLSFIRSICAVPLLPLHLMWRGIIELWEEVTASGWHNELLGMFQYLELEWRPRFPELCVFGVDDRTNNCSESDNHMMANVVPQNHPNVWALVGGFVQMEYLAWCDKISVDHFRAVTPARRVRSVLNDQRVRRASQMIVNGDITPGHFLQHISSITHAAAVYGLQLRDDDSDDSDED
ncbi:hypothetical protein ONE63_011214 [Megalurothrips usitatus]|uniref:MULE transposase domain-containing protein n=1 Tax=Megalurothrips usitatus TaxID=439358 RepID=A0AAV7X695_9NEOP|nr:hypothetical protein ONE63_011214 [Megalurothrips usitatus]